MYGPAEEVGDQVGGVLGAARGEDPVAVAAGDLGVEQVVGVEGGEQVLRDHQRPHVGVVGRAVAAEVAEAGEHVGAVDVAVRRVALLELDHACAVRSAGRSVWNQ